MHSLGKCNQPCHTDRKYDRIRIVLRSFSLNKISYSSLKRIKFVGGNFYKLMEGNAALANPLLYIDVYIEDIPPIRYGQMLADLRIGLV